MAPQQSRLLALPGELHNRIYHEYLSIGAEHGYVYDFEAGKLRTADMRPIDLNLTYTCRPVASKMWGMALGLHTVTFSTVFSEDLRPFRVLLGRALRWPPGAKLGRALRWPPGAKLGPGQLRASDERRDGRRGLSTLRRDSFLHHFLPHEVPGIKQTRPWDYSNPCLRGFGEPPSLFRDMACDVLHLASTDPAIHAKMVKSVRDIDRNWHPPVWYSMLREPWKIPTGPELDGLVDQVACEDL